MSGFLDFVGLVGLLLFCVGAMEFAAAFIADTWLPTWKMTGPLMNWALVCFVLAAVDGLLLAITQGVRLGLGLGC